MKHKNVLVFVHLWALFMLLECFSKVCKRTEECYKYEKINNDWRQIANLDKVRFRTSCWVSGGAIIVTGE